MISRAILLHPLHPGVPFHARGPAPLVTVWFWTSTHRESVSQCYLVLANAGFLKVDPSLSRVHEHFEACSIGTNMVAHCCLLWQPPYHEALDGRAGLHLHFYRLALSCERRQRYIRTNYGTQWSFAFFHVMQ